jgi:hypothetical protein
METIETWLRNSIPGIILLGAVGSILAFYLHIIVRRAVGWLFRRYGAHLILRFGLLNLRMFLVQRMVLRDMRAKNDIVAQVMYYIRVTDSVRYSFRRLLFFAAGIWLYFYHYGVSLTWGSGFLIILTFLSMYLWLLDASMYLAVYARSFGVPWTRARKALHDPAVLDTEAKSFAEAFMKLSADFSTNPPP